MKRRTFSIKRGSKISQAALALSLLALAYSNFADAAGRILLEATAVLYLWCEWIIFPVMAWWFERKDLAKTIAEMSEKETKQE